LIAIGAVMAMLGVLLTLTIGLIACLFLAFGGAGHDLGFGPWPHSHRAGLENSGAAPLDSNE
jgi:hypothetical protein